MKLDPSLNQAWFKLVDEDEEEGKDEEEEENKKKEHRKIKKWHQ